MKREGLVKKTKTVKSHKRGVWVKAEKPKSKKKASTPARKKKATTKAKKSSYSIKKTKGGLFYVTDGYSKYGNYYKTRNGAKKMLDKIKFQSGEIQTRLFK